MRLKILLTALLASTSVLAADHVLTDNTGRSVTVPDHPERIVVMHEPLLGLPLLDLGVNVTGSYGRSDDGKMATAVDFIDTVLDGKPAKPKGIGAFGQLDLEKLRALHPDLIIGTERDGDKAAQLSTIAPVYLQKVSTGLAHGFSVEGDLAKVVGQDDVFGKRKAAYIQRVEALHAKLSPKAGATYLALIVHDQINLVGEMSGAIQAIEDLGYKRAALDGIGASNGLGSTFSLPINAETFGRLNPDVLIIMNSYANKDRSETAIRAHLDKLLPGWDKFLKPAREGRILYLDSGKVATPTIASAEHTLDAIESWRKF